MKIRYIFISISILFITGFSLHAIFYYFQLNEIIKNNNISEQNFIYIISLVITITYLQKTCPIKFSHLGFSKDYYIKTLLLGSIGGAVASVILFPYKVGNYYENTARRITSEGESLLIVILFFFSVTVLIPICEELLYRSGIYRILRKKYQKIFSVLLSSILFSIMHIPGSIIAFVKLFLVSLIFIFVYEKSSKIGASIVSHILCNIIWYSAAYSYRFV